MTHGKQTHTYQQNEVPLMKKEKNTKTNCEQKMLVNFKLLGSLFPARTVKFPGDIQVM